ncbi:hypothetical protein [Halodesulfovibrio aestuarii]|uniref:hypothetical protein n=1 Tax=Halodesulfovibrio aestuarii TaxID=126333 RepID=UPI000401F417
MRKNRKSIKDWWDIIGYGLSIGIAYAFYKLGKDAGHSDFELYFMSSLVGMLVGIFTYVVSSVQEMKKRVGPLKKIYSALRDCSNSFDHIYSKLKHVECIVPKDNIGLVWNDLSWSIKKSYLAVNYEDSDALKTKLAQNCIGIQNLKSSSGTVQVEKLFIVDSIDELNSLIDLFRCHLEGQVKLKYIEKKDILNPDGYLKKKAQLVSSWDFSIIDDELFFVWELDKKRKGTGGRLFFSKNPEEVHRDFLEALFNEGTIIDEKFLTKLEGKNLSQQVVDFEGLSRKNRNENNIYVEN